MIEIRLYGKLRRQASDRVLRETGVLRVPPGEDETVKTILEQIKLSPKDIYTIFLNSKLVAARSNMVRWLRYPQAGGDPLAWNLEIGLTSGDRIGIFGRDMSALVV